MSRLSLAHAEEVMKNYCLLIYGDIRADKKKSKNNEIEKTDDRFGE